LFRAVLAIVILACYLAAAALLIASVYRLPIEMRSSQFVSGLIVSVFAILLHAFALWKGVAAKPSFALTIAETASLVGLGVAVISVLIALKQPRFAGASAMLLALSGLVATATNEGARQFIVARSGWELDAHIALSVVAYSLITVGTALALALALLDSRLRKRQPLGWLSVMPSVESLETGMFAALGSGFALLSLALFSGFFLVENLWAQSLSRKIVLSCLTWLILAILLFGRWRFGWRGRIARNWTIGGFVVLCLAYFGSKVVLEIILGRHWG
jgi:ABC-type uncharacterized transport system permease subunit